MFLYLKTSVRERWPLFLAVILVVSLLSFGYMGSQSVTDRIVMQAKTDLEENWRYHYDLLVLPGLPEETKGLQDGWVAPQSTIANYGGISMEDLELIRTIPDVQVAAPLSLIGYSTVNGIDVEYVKAEPGKYYKIDHSKTVFDGLKNYELSNTSEIKRFISNGTAHDDLSSRLGQSIHTPVIGTQFKNPNELLIVAIAPEAEDEIFSFSDSLLWAGQSLIDVDFENTDGLGGIPILPAIALSTNTTAMDETLVISTINIPDDVNEEDYNDDPMGYLSSLSKTEEVNLTVDSFSYRWNRKHVALELLGGSKYNELDISSFSSTSIDVYQYSSIRFESEELDNNGIPLISAKQTNVNNETLTSIPLYRNKISTMKRGFGVDIINYYNPEKVKPLLSGAWNEGEPVDIYTPHHSVAIEDGAGNKIEPTPLLPLPLKNAYYTGAPDLITTLEVAKLFYKSEPPLSSVRVVVSGIDERSEESQRKIEQVAEQIIELTGHHVEIMLGSSSSKVHIDLGATGTGEAGIVEEGWQQAGVSWSIEEQIEKTNILLFIYLLTINSIFCYTVITHSLLRRSVEFSMLRAIGWPRQQIIKMLSIEVICLSLLSIFPVIMANSQLDILTWYEIAVLFLIIIPVIAIGYSTGSYKVLKASPRAGLEGESVQWKFTRLVSINGLSSYTLHQMMRRPLRFGLLAIVLALTSFMVILFIATQQSLSDFLYLSFLGDTIDLNLKGFQKAFILVGLVMAVSIVFLLLFLNMQERKQEFFTLRSIGWSLKKIQLFVGIEVSTIALIGTVFGVMSAEYLLTFFTGISVQIGLIIAVVLFPTLLLLLFSYTMLVSMKLTGVDKSHYV